MDGMFVWMDGIDGRMDGWMEDSMYEWNGWMDELDGWMNGCINVRWMVGLMDGWMDGWMDGLDGWMNGWKEA